MLDSLHPLQYCYSAATLRVKFTVRLLQHVSVTFRISLQACYSRD